MGTRKLWRLLVAVGAISALLLSIASCAGAEEEMNARFNASPISGTIPLEVRFTDQSTGDVTDWAWDFENDGTVDSTQQNPSHVYDTVGQYSVSLKVTGPSGSDIETKTNYVSAQEPGHTVEWLPDGVIDAGEYTKTNAYGDYEIYWRSDGEYIYIGMKAKTSGWVALGIQPGSRMKDADMVFGFVKGGQATVYDLFSTGDFGPHPPDTELGGTADIAEYGGKEQDGYTIIEFKRDLNTGDDYDNPLSSGVNKIIWAYGASDDLTLQHSTRGYGEIDL
jgi:PKD repeat protein